MESEILIGILVRLLPAIAVAVLAFVAAADRKTRERWGNLLYQVGSIRPDQREDPKVGKGVKWPFFVVALGLLFWPIQYSMHATRKIDASQNDLKPQTAPPSDLKAPTSAATATGTPQPSGSTTTVPAPATAPVPSTAPAPSSDLQPATAPAAPAPPSDLKPAPAIPPG